MMVASVAAAVMLTVAGPALAGSGPEGFWRTPDDNGVVQISVCGDALCGSVVTSDQLKKNPDQTDVRNADKALRGRPVKGLSIITGMKGAGPTWAGGRVYNPDDGRTYTGSIRLAGPDTLKLTGCVFAPLCRTETWTRLPGPP